MCLFLLARLWQYCAAGEGGELTEYIERGVNLYMSFLVCHKENNCQAYPVLDFLVNFPVALAYGCSLGADLSALGQLDVSFLFSHPVREALSSEKLCGLIDYQARIDLKIKESRRSRGLDDFVIVGVPMPLSTSFSSALSASFGFFEITPFVHKVAAIDYLMQQNPELGDTAILVDDRAHEFKRTLSGREGYRVNETSVPFKVCLPSKNTIQVWLPDLFQQKGVHHIKEHFSSDRRRGVFFDIDETMEIEAVSTGPVTQDTLVDVREQGHSVYLITNAVCTRRKKLDLFLAQCGLLVSRQTQAMPDQAAVTLPTPTAAGSPASASVSGHQNFEFFSSASSRHEAEPLSVIQQQRVDNQTRRRMTDCCVMS